jgi:hypothetical protein
MIFINCGDNKNLSLVSTREAGDSIKPGVERSGTPGRLQVMSQAHEVGDSGLVRLLQRADYLYLT